MLPWFQITTIYIGPVPIQVWGLSVALGMGAATWFLSRWAKKNNIDTNILLDFILIILAGGLLGARLVHILFYDIGAYLADPLEIIRVWHGGMSSFGGMVGGALALWWYHKKKGFLWLKQVSLFTFFDKLMYGLFIGWVFGRVGCVMIHDHPGILCDCSLAFDAPSGARLDMAFLELLALFPLAVFFFLTRKKKWPSGVRMAIFLGYYGITRFVLDFFRAQDVAHSDARYLGLTPGQYFAILMLGVGGKLYKSAQKK